jgi:hypothetical protein
MESQIANQQSQLETLISALIKNSIQNVPTPVEPANTGPSRMRVDIPHTAGKPLDGILAHLTRKCGGNVHDKGVVDITSSSIDGDNPEYGPKNIANFTDSSHFGTKNQQGSWLCLNFKQMRIIPTHYTLVTFHDCRGWTAQHPHSWILKGRDDKSQCRVFDERKGVTELNGPDRTATFAISKTMKCSAIWLTVSAPNWGEEFGLELYAFEVFGTLLE